MLFVSDVHGAFEPLRRVVEMGETVVILGDLANLTDYRDGQGVVAQVLGLDFARAAAGARARGDFETMRSLWVDRVGDRAEEVREEIRQAIDDQYEQAADALASGTGLVIHGNVDRPASLMRHLPPSFSYVHGEVRELDGMRLGLVGGGMETPLRLDAEVPDEEMTALLERLGPVDVLCTHVPPAVRALRRDVITGREERGSAPIMKYLLEHQPRYHLFGDVHQAQATTWRLGATRCINAGYFRATSRFLRLVEGRVTTGRIRP